MPTLIQQTSGATLAGAASMAAMFQVGGTLGAIAVGRLMDRFEPHRVLSATPPSTRWSPSPPSFALSRWRRWGLVRCRETAGVTAGVTATADPGGDPLARRGHVRR